MPTIGELFRALPPRKRRCSQCVHCHVEGVDEWNEPLVHCHLGNWDMRQKTMMGAQYTRMVCEEFEESGEMEEME